MFALTRQEQWIVAFIMLALALGVFARVSRQRSPSPVAPAILQTNPGSPAEPDSHEENIR